jgi:hypothetical protein
MFRSLILSALVVALLATLSMPFLVLHPGEFFFGGQHRITSETHLEKDSSFYFAQVVVDEDALVDCQIFLYSSTLDLHGHVTKDIHAFESDLTFRENAHVDGKITQTDFIHWTLLLPQIVRIP